MTFLVNTQKHDRELNHFNFLKGSSEKQELRKKKRENNTHTHTQTTRQRIRREMRLAHCIAYAHLQFYKIR